MNADLVRQVAAHHPGDAREFRSLSRIRALLAWLPRPFDEHADATHVTASGIVLDGHGHLLLHRHKRLGRWLQPGGHLDPGELPWEAARRETAEETGLVATHPSSGPLLVHVDVHEGPRGHVHLDLRYLLRADGDAPPAPAIGESPEVAWCSSEQVADRGDASTVAALVAARRHPRARGCFGEEGGW
jgi:8-oxo-dGTP pyrophosphatase MutT (NUDIX family)